MLFASKAVWLCFAASVSLAICAGAGETPEPVSFAKAGDGVCVVLPATELALLFATCGSAVLFTNVCAVLLATFGSDGAGAGFGVESLWLKAGGGAFA